MRSILEYTAVASAGADVTELAMTSLAEYGWAKADLGVSRDDLVQLANNVISAAARVKRDLPLSPESQFIQAAIDRRFGSNGPARNRTQTAGAEAGVERFAPFSFE